jgi:rod shape determining protein RodA
MPGLRLLFRINFWTLVNISILMSLSLLTIASVTKPEESISFFTPLVVKQIQWFCMGWVCFFFFALSDYRKLKEWTWLFYLIVVVALIGLLFTSPMLHVRRWYRIPGIGLTLQPSEFTKLAVVFAMAWILDREFSSKRKTALFLALVTFIPFLLILKQPDLGSALILYPIFLVISYYADVPKLFFKLLAFSGLGGLILLSLMYTGLLSHEEMRPYFCKVLKEYQYERLNPDTYHQKATQAAIALGGLTGSGWRKSSFSSEKWLPAGHTDSVFAAFGEEFGFWGLCFLLLLFYLLIYTGFKVSKSAKDTYGRVLACGLSTYLAMHIIMNAMMMCGFLPISGVPMIILTYGGNSVLTTMSALGILQSIYIRRFMF